MRVRSFLLLGIGAFMGVPWCMAADLEGLAALAQQMNATIQAIGSFQPQIESCAFANDPAKSEEENHCRNLDQLLRADKALSDILHAIPRNDQESWGSVRNMLYSTEKRIKESGRLCHAARFSRCYRNAKKTISLVELEKIFREFTQDKHFRYGTAGGACHLRAEALAFTLAEKGFAAQTLRIQHSPTLIALERSRSGSLTGGYYDYGGFHTLIQIMVKQGDREVPYLLDPQFMNEPVPRDQYFLRTTGQVCTEKVSDRPASSLNCYYNIYPQNHPSEEGYYRPPGRAVTPNEACGWQKDPLHEDFARMSEGTGEIRGILKLLNGEITPPLFAGRPVNEQSSRALILHAYENYESRLREKLMNIESQISSTEDSLRNNAFFLETEEEARSKLQTRRLIKEQLLRDLLALPEKLAEIRKNLKSNQSR